jgi:hypothetical protein
MAKLTGPGSWVKTRTKASGCPALADKKTQQQRHRYTAVADWAPTASNRRLVVVAARHDLLARGPQVDGVLVLRRVAAPRVAQRRVGVHHACGRGERAGCAGLGVLSTGPSPPAMRRPAPSGNLVARVPSATTYATRPFISLLPKTPRCRHRKARPAGGMRTPSPIPSPTSPRTSPLPSLHAAPKASVRPATHPRRTGS